jgi:hypothetical protein
MEHDGLPLSFYSDGCITSLSFRVLLFPDQVNHAAWKEKFLKPPWIGKKRRENPAIPFAFDEKTVGAGKKSCLEEVIEET